MSCGRACEIVTPLICVCCFIAIFTIFAVFGFHNVFKVVVMWIDENTGPEHMPVLSATIALCVAFGIPGMFILIIVPGYLYGFWWGLLVSWTG